MTLILRGISFCLLPASSYGEQVPCCRIWYRIWQMRRFVPPWEKKKGPPLSGPSLNHLDRELVLPGRERLSQTGVGLVLPALAVVTPLALAVAPPAGLLLLEPLLFRRLHVRHVLPVLLQNATPIYLAPEAFECTINVFVVSNLNTNSQRGSLLGKSVFKLSCLCRRHLIDATAATRGARACFFSAASLRLSAPFSHQSARSS